jgi:hypothetical protein
VILAGWLHRHVFCGGQHHARGAAAVDPGKGSRRNESIARRLRRGFFPARTSARRGHQSPRKRIALPSCCDFSNNRTFVQWENRWRAARMRPGCG